MQICLFQVSTYSDLFSFHSPHSLINADFCVASSLIAYGALLGKVSPVQLMIVTLFGVTLFAVEEYLILSLLHVSLTNNTLPQVEPILSKQGEYSLKHWNFFFCAAFSHSAEMLVAQ